MKNCFMLQRNKYTRIIANISHPVLLAIEETSDDGLFEMCSETSNNGLFEMCSDSILLGPEDAFNHTESRR